MIVQRINYRIIQADIFFIVIRVNTYAGQAAVFAALELIDGVVYQSGVKDADAC
jgi:hypothetical protein